MVETPKAVLDDYRKQLNVYGMENGLVTNVGALSLGPHQTPDSLNVFGYQGELLFRGGYSTFATDGTGDGADASFVYFDGSGNMHMLEWREGDIYDVVTGTPVLVANNVYQTGDQVAIDQLGSTLYWSTINVTGGQMRQYNGTVEQQVPYVAGAGKVPPPACMAMVAYAGSLVAIAPVIAGVWQKSQILHCTPNDPSEWFAADLMTVGTNDDGICNFGLLMGVVPGGVVNTGIPATRQLLIGKDKGNLFLYQGALGSLTENAIPCPVGAADGNCAVYIPTKEGLGAVMFLGTDGQFWLTNGAQAIVASDPIKNYVYTLYRNALINNPDQKFHAVYNQRFQYYMCDFGQATQLVFKWDQQAWWPFNGWPSGPYMTASDEFGIPQIYVSGNEVGALNTYAIGLDATNDNGSDIVAYYKSPYLHGGKPEREKIYQWFELFSYNRGTTYEVIGYGMPRSDGVTPETEPLIFNDPAVGAVSGDASAGIWDTSDWDDALWADGLPNTLQPYQLSAMHGRLVVLSEETKWTPAGMPQPLRSGAAQFQVSWRGGIPDFRILGYSVGMIFRGTGFVGNLPYNTKGNDTDDTNRFTNIGD